MSTPKSPAQDRENEDAANLAPGANREAEPVNRLAKKDSATGANEAGDAKKEGEPSSSGNARARGDEWHDAYFDTLATTGQVTKAALAAKVSSRTVARRRLSDPKFREEETAAMAEAAAFFESEAVRRATEGVRSEYYNAKGVLSSIKIEFSDTILLRLLEKCETGSWRQRQQIEHGAPGQFATRAERKAALAKAREEAAASTQRGADARPLSLPSKN